MNHFSIDLHLIKIQLDFLEGFIQTFDPDLFMIYLPVWYIIDSGFCIPKAPDTETHVAAM